MKYKKEELAIKLLSIISKMDENNKKNYYDFQTKQVLLYNLYKIFTKNKLKPCIIEKNELNYKIWQDSNKYIYDIIQAHIEQNKNLFSLAQYIGKDINMTIKILKAFISFSKEGKIILNQNNVLCSLEDLKNEGVNKEEIIPEELKKYFEEIRI